MQTNSPFYSSFSSQPFSQHDQIYTLPTESASSFVASDSEKALSSVNRILEQRKQNSPNDFIDNTKQQEQLVSSQLVQSVSSNHSSTILLIIFKLIYYFTDDEFYEKYRR